MRPLLPRADTDPLEADAEAVTFAVALPGVVAPLVVHVSSVELQLATPVDAGGEAIGAFGMCNCGSSFGRCRWEPGDCERDDRVDGSGGAIR